MLPHYDRICDLPHVASAPQTNNISHDVILQNYNPTQHILDMRLVTVISLCTSGTSTILFGLLKQNLEGC
jgi:hypothetical protein